VSREVVLPIQTSTNKTTSLAEVEEIEGDCKYQS